MLGIANSSHQVTRALVKIWLQSRAATASYSTAIDQSQSQINSIKSPQVERAIRIKSQQKRREKYQAGSQFPSVRQKWDEQVKFQGRDSRGSSGQKVNDGSKDHFRPRNSTTSQASSDSNRKSRHFANDGERHSLRQNRHKIILQLADIIKSAKKSSSVEKENYFGEAQTIFDSMSGIAKREPRIYTAMIRIAILASKRKRALGYFTDMKKNGVAPDLFTYRAIIEGFSNVENVSSEDREVHAQFENVFEAMVKDWDSAMKQIEEGSKTELENAKVEKEKTTSTAIAYTKSKEASLQSFIQCANLFSSSFSYYLRYLILLKDIKGAIRILKRGKDLAATKEAKRLVPQLSFQLSNRFLNQILLNDFGRSSEVQSSITMAFTLLTNSIINKEIRKEMAENLGWRETEWKSLKEAKDKEQLDLETALTYALIALTKYDVEQKEILASDALAEMYNDDHLASLPLLSDEVGLRYATQLCGSRNPTLSLDIFNKALVYNQVMSNDTIRNPPGFKSQIPPDYRDVNTLWSNAMDVAVMKFDDIGKGMSILEKAIEFKNGSTRLKPTRLPFSYIMSHFMRRIADQGNWEAAVKLWQYWLEDDKRTRASREIFHLRFLTHFLMTAFRTERKGLNVKDKDKKHQDKEEKGEIKAQREDEGKRPSRVAMKFLADEIDPKDETIWKWCQDALMKSTEATKERLTSHDAEHETMAQKFLGAVLMTSKLALDSGPQGIDLAPKADVEAWRGIMRQAGRTFAVGTGKQSFDQDEADWLRSGVGSKSPLALTLDDMRNLIGE